MAITAAELGNLAARDDLNVGEMTITAAAAVDRLKRPAPLNVFVERDTGRASSF